MRSFAVIAGFAAAANAYAYGSYEAKNATSSVAAHETPANGYPVASSSAGYPASSAPAYTTTKIVTGLTTVCPEPTTVTYGTKTYTVSTSTTLIDEECEYSTVVTIKPTPSAAHPTSVATPANTHYAPPVYSQAPPAAPYPSAGNGTVPQPSGAAKPTASGTKPASPEFTGAASQAGVGLLAVIGAVAAFL